MKLITPMSRASIARVCTCWRHRGLQTHNDQLAVCHPLNQVHSVTALTLSLVGAATSIIFVATNTCLSRKVFLATNLILFVATSLFFVATNTCLSQQNMPFVATKVCLSRQTKLSLSREIFVATKVLSRQAYICRDKRRVL